MKKKYKILCIMFSLMLVIQMLPLNVIAAQSDFYILKVNGQNINFVEGASFDYDTNTLTLNNVNITDGFRREYSSTYEGEGKTLTAIEVGFVSEYDGPLNIEVIGNNTINNNSDSSEQYSFSVLSMSGDNDVNIFGDGTLNISAQNTRTANPGFLFYVDGNLNIEDTKININIKDRTSGYSSSKTVMNVNETFTMSGSANVNINSGDNTKMYGIYAKTLLVEDDANIYVEGSNKNNSDSSFATYAITASTVIQNGGKVHAVAGKSNLGYSTNAISTANYILNYGTLIADSVVEDGSNPDYALRYKPQIYAAAKTIYSGKSEETKYLTKENLDYNEEEYVEIYATRKPTSYPDIALSGSSIKIGPKTEGYFVYNDFKRIYLTNLKDTPITNLQTKLVGTDAQYFEFTENELKTLNKYDATSFKVELTEEGLEKGTYKAAVMVTGTGISTKLIPVEFPVNSKDDVYLSLTMDNIKPEYSLYAYEELTTNERIEVIENELIDTASVGGATFDVTYKSSDTYNVKASVGEVSDSKDIKVDFLSLNDLEINNAKSVVVDGSIEVPYKSTQATKTQEVQNYVDDILNRTKLQVDNVKAVVTHKSENIYIVTYTCFTKTQTEEIKMTITEKSAKSYLVYYNNNGGEGYQKNELATEKTPFTLPSKTTITPPTGKILVGWGIGSATGPIVQPGGTYTFTEQTEVFALWGTNTVFVTYNPNGGTGGTKNIEVEKNTPISLPDDKDLNITPPTGKVFDGWSLTKNGAKIGSSYTFTKDTILYAVWRDETTTTIKFDSNGGSGKMDSISVKESGIFELPENKFTPPTDKVFVGWSNTKESYGEAEAIGYTVGFMAGTTAEVIGFGGLTTVTFYAIWIDKPKTDEISLSIILSDEESAEEVAKINMMRNIPKGEDYILPPTYEGMYYSTTPDGKNPLIYVNSDNNVTVYAVEKNTEPTYGDVNLDTKINIIDSIEVLKHLSKIDTLTDTGLAAADVTGDGKVNISDAITIQMYLSKKITEFPAEK